MTLLVALILLSGRCLAADDRALGTSFVLFCNEPGNYEKGEYARVVVK